MSFFNCPVRRAIASGLLLPEAAMYPSGFSPEDEAYAAVQDVHQYAITNELKIFYLF